MFSPKKLVPVLMVLGAFSGAAHAQSVSYFSTTYSVQVKYEMWRNGSTYWSEVFETNSYAEADLMEELLQSAIDNGSIDDIMNTGFDWVIVDVRIVTEYHYPWIVQPLYPRELAIRRQ